jgi:hypothetical protein
MPETLNAWSPILESPISPSISLLSQSSNRVNNNNVNCLNELSFQQFLMLAPLSGWEIISFQYLLPNFQHNFCRMRARINKAAIPPAFELLQYEVSSWSSRGFWTVYFNSSCNHQLLMLNRYLKTWRNSFHFDNGFIPIFITVPFRRFYLVCQA